MWPPWGQRNFAHPVLREATPLGGATVGGICGRRCLSRHGYRGGNYLWLIGARPACPVVFRLDSE
eukprot:5472347-Amphidinium_carterae.1